MDLLYSRYSNPLEFMRLYIDQGRFGEFTTEIISAENKRKIEYAEEKAEERLWLAYVHSNSDKSFNEWKNEILRPAKAPVMEKSRPAKRDEDMTREDIDNLLSRLFPTQRCYP